MQGINIEDVNGMNKRKLELESPSAKLPRSVEQVLQARAQAIADSLVQSGGNAPAGPLGNGQIVYDGSGGGDITDSYPCPEDKVGKVIGKQGATIKDLMARTSTTIRIDLTVQGPTKPVQIIGSRANIEKAKALVKEVIEAEAPVKDAAPGEVSKKIECSTALVGRIIGRGGDTIKSLQHASGTRIIISPKVPGSDVQTVEVNGRADLVDRAFNMVSELINAEDAGSGPRTDNVGKAIEKHCSSISKTIEVPKPLVGRIIGRGGENIKGMQRHFCARVQIDQTSDPSKVTITGTVGAISGIEAAVAELLSGDGMQPPVFRGGPAGPPRGGFPGGGPPHPPPGGAYPPPYGGGFAPPGPAPFPGGPYMGFDPMSMGAYGMPNPFAPPQAPGGGGYGAPHGAGNPQAGKPNPYAAAAPAAGAGYSPYGGAAPSAGPAGGAAPATGAYGGGGAPPTSAAGGQHYNPAPSGYQAAPAAQQAHGSYQTAPAAAPAAHQPQQQAQNYGTPAPAQLQQQQPHSYGQPAGSSQSHSPYGSAAPAQQTSPYGSAALAAPAQQQQQQQQQFQGYAQQQQPYGAAPAAPAPPAAASPWMELRDDKGQTYYYNPTAGVSQWDKPAGL